jgi:signal peptidase II
MDSSRSMGQVLGATSQAWRWLLAAAVLSTFIGCDQATKFLATQTLRNQPRQAFWADTVRLEYALNSGGCLSLGANLSPPARWWIFVGFNLLLTVSLGGFLCRQRQVSLLMFGSIVLIIAGGVGNLIDRVFNQGLVTDFINVGIGPVRTGIFNVADVAITVGAFTAMALLCFTARPAEVSVNAPC